MKKTLIAFVFGLVATAGMFAAGGRDAVTTIEGKLAVTDSVLTVVKGDNAWVLPFGVSYQIAWENNIKAGDSIKAEGYERTSPRNSEIENAIFFAPTKVWVNGKEVDLSTVGRYGRMNGGPNAAMIGSAPNGRPGNKAAGPFANSYNDRSFRRCW